MKILSVLRVLILIVLDHLIMHKEIILITNVLSNSLNPYCIGSSNHATIEYRYEGNRLSLNPYCIGSSNHAQSLKEAINMISEGLNPYCIGSSNHAIRYIV